MAQTKTTAVILQAQLDKIQASNSSYSMRAFAQKIGVSPSLVVRVLKGERSISLEKAKSIAEILNMDPVESQQFLKSVALSNVKDDAEIGKIKELLFKDQREVCSHKDITTESMRAFNHWYHFAILDLSLCDDFKSDHCWIAKRLNLTPLQVKIAVERLLAVGLLKEVDGQWRKSNEFLKFAPKIPSSIARNLHSQFINKGLAQLDKTDQHSFDHRDISSLTIPVDLEHLDQIKKEIQLFKNKVANIMKTKSPSELYQMNIQLFPLTEIADTSEQFNENTEELKNA